MSRTLNTPKFTGTGPRAESTPFPSPFGHAPVFDATQKQITFLIKLASERGINLVGLVCEAEKDEYTGEWISKIGKRDASKMISEYMEMPKVAKPGTASVEITEGMYRTPEGKIYKVQVAHHGSGKLYAKELKTFTHSPENAKNTTDVWFDYAPGVVRTLKIEWKMTLDQAKEFGALYGTCCVCGRVLTDEKSIEAGIGPVCASKF